MTTKETTGSPTPLSAETPRRGWRASIFEPVPIGPLVQFRLALGAILLWEIYRYLSEGWPRGLFLETPLHFHYYGFEWVKPLPAVWHLSVFYALVPLAACHLCGLFYRPVTVALFVGWAYVFLLDQTLYLNHLYLIVLITGLMVCLPAHRALSLDVLRRPALRATHVPRWTIALPRVLVGLVYFFGGVAKLNPDWLTGVPMQMMLLERADLIGQPAGEPWVALFFAYGGLCFDLFIVPLLWWRKTRIVGLLLAVGFHLTNHAMFRIGIFPWFMIAATLILWPPFKPTLLNLLRLYTPLVGLGMLASVLTDRDVPAFGWGLWILAVYIAVFPPREFLRIDRELLGTEVEPRPVSDQRDWLVIGFLVLLLGVQVGLPLRHWLYPGDVSWTEEGHRWSWHMKLRIKYAVQALFFVVDGNGQTVAMIDPFAPDSPLTPRQAGTMSTRPELIRQFARMLSRQFAADHPGPIHVYANVLVSLNNREPRPLIDPEADLAAVEPTLWPPADWILPLDAPPPTLERVDVAKLLEERQQFAPVAEEQ